MKVLVACEFSGRVREAFKQLGHDAWSCDLLPTEIPGQHIVGDVLSILDYGWDLMIAHPPCTFLAYSGVQWLYVGGKKSGGKNPERWADMALGAEFFVKLLNAPIPRIAIENPIIHGYAQAIIGQKYAQIIQPWQFGHGDSKKTCLWLKGLPPLMATLINTGRSHDWHSNSRGKKDRQITRSRTYTGIADAMAKQWGGVAVIEASA